MLINFRFKNVRSFYKETNFSMQAIKNGELQETNSFIINKDLMNKDENELLKAAVIFGSNASGKSNVLKALAYMKNVIAYSGSQQPIVKNNEFFAFYENAYDIPSEYEVEFIENQTYYKYGFSILKGEIIKEYLYKRKERLTPVFTRGGDAIEVSGLNKSATKLLRTSSQSLFLVLGINFNLDIKQNLNDVINWFKNLLIVFEGSANDLDIYTLENGKYRNQALKVLELADIGIKDMSVKKSKVANINNVMDVIRINTQQQINPYKGQLKQEQTDIYNIDLETDFSVFNKDKKEIGQRAVRLYQHAGFNSEGTAKLLLYLGWMLVALDKGMVIVVDELDSKLHFLIADYLLQIFNSIDKNPHNAQLICTANNVMLMDEDLRRDQIYFTSKDQYGESELVSLIDFKNVRKNDLFSKKYLAGFYSKLPDMENDF